MKKIMVVLLAVMMVLSFAACGEGDGGVKGDILNTGNISVLVPAGWQPMEMDDMWDEYEGDKDPTTVTLYKTTEEIFGLEEPNITISYFEGSSFMSPEFFYENTEAREDVTIGNYTWTGFDAQTEDLFSGELLPVYVIWSQQADYTVQVSMFPQAAKGEFAFDDADVQAILNSIAIDTVDLSL